VLNNFGTSIVAATGTATVTASVAAASDVTTATAAGAGSGRRAARFFTKRDGIAEPSVKRFGRGLTLGGGNALQLVGVGS
jgi:hypothetical protein